MSKKGKVPQSKSRTRLYVKGIVVLIVLAFFAYWSIYSYTHPTESVTTTISTTSPFATNTTGPVLSRADFNLTISNGCVFTNQTTGQTELLFVLTVTNRFNAHVHYVNESVWGGVISTSSYKMLSRVSFNVTRQSSDYTDKLVLYLTDPTSVVPIGAYILGINLKAYTQETNGPIVLLTQIPLSQIYACST